MNPRRYAHSAEIRRGLIFSDIYRTTIMRSNGGDIWGNVLMDRSGMETGDGVVVYEPIPLTDATILVQCRASGAGMIAGTYTPGRYGHGWCIWLDDTGLHATHRAGEIDATVIDVAGNFLDNDWHTVSYRLDLTSGTHSLLIDDIEDTGTTEVSGPIATGRSIVIGGWENQLMPGIIGAVKIYQVALTDREREIYHGR